MNRLYFGDNLDVMREHIRDETIDLVYLDPPFNSNATYNLLFRSASGRQADAQIEAFDDTWHWGDSASAAYHDVVRQGAEVAGLLKALRSFLGTSDMMAYLAMMTVRLVELRRVMKETATLYLHCDHTASHYLKIILDGVFGPQRFLNELTWKRSTSHGNVARNFGSLTDTILVYARGETYRWNQQYTQFAPDYIEARFRGTDPDGRRWQSVTLRNPSRRPNLHYKFPASNGITYLPHPNGWACDPERMRRYDRENRLHFPSKEGGQLRLKMYLDESAGIKLQNLWDDIPPVNSQAEERIGYPTQKPIALLERIIRASSDPDQVLLDPFCGCGTAVHAAQHLGRRWIGIDVTHLAIEVIETRIVKAFDDPAFEVVGRPVDFEGAVELARRNKHQFQIWAVWLAQGTPYQDGKKGRDRGIDGQRFFSTGTGDADRALISVKGGDNLNPAMVRDLRGTVEREEAACGLLILLRPPTREMEREAAAAGMTDVPGRTVPRLQIRTVAQLFERNGFDLPVTWAEPMHPVSAAIREERAVKRRRKVDPRQKELLLPTKGGRPVEIERESAQPVASTSIGTRSKRLG